MRCRYSGLAPCLLLVLAVHAGDELVSVDRLLSNLASSDPSTREAATSALTDRGTLVRGAVVKRWQESKDPEVRARTLAVLQGIDGNEFFGLMAAMDGPAPGRPSPAGSPPSCAVDSKDAASPDVTTLLAQASDGDWHVAEKALLHVNQMAQGVIFSVSMQEGSKELPEPFARLLVILGRARLARGMDGWGRLLGGGSAPLPATLRPLGPDDIRALISRDPGEVAKGEDKERPEHRTRADGGVFSYRYLDRAPFYPIERVSTVGVVHQFTYDAEGRLAEWRVCSGSDGWWVDVRFVSGEPAGIADSNGYAVTFK